MTKFTTLVTCAVGMAALLQSGVSLKTQEVYFPVQEIETETKTDWDRFVESVIYVESRGDDSAYNKKEKAVGCLQIRPIMVREVNRVLRKADSELIFTMEDRWDRQKSIVMFDIMAEEVFCCEHLTQMEFFEIVARRWNGGGRGDRKESTVAYWERVKNKFGSDN